MITFLILLETPLACIFFSFCLKHMLLVYAAEGTILTPQKGGVLSMVKL